MADALLQIISCRVDGRIVIAVRRHPRNVCRSPPDLLQPLQRKRGQLADRMNAEPPQMAIHTTADAEHLVDAERPQLVALVI